MGWREALGIIEPLDGVDAPGLRRAYRWASSRKALRGSAGPAWLRSLPVPAHGGLVWGLGCQRNFVCPEACFLCWDARSSARFRACRCFSAQVSHLLWPGIAGFGQSRQSPSSLDFRRFS